MTAHAAKRPNDGHHTHCIKRRQAYKTTGAHRATEASDARRAGGGRDATAAHKWEDATEGPYARGGMDAGNAENAR